MACQWSFYKVPFGGIFLSGVLDHHQLPGTAYAGPDGRYLHAQPFGAGRRGPACSATDSTAKIALLGEKKVVGCMENLVPWPKAARHGVSGGPLKKHITQKEH